MSRPKYAARPERVASYETRLANARATRVSQVDTSHVVPLAQLPDLATGTTSQRTGEQATDPPTAPTAPVPPLLSPPVPPPPAQAVTVMPRAGASDADSTHEPIPDAYTLIARFPLLSIGGAKFTSRGDLDITFRVSVDDVDKVLPLWRLRRDGFFFYMDAYGLAFTQLDELAALESGDPGTLHGGDGGF